MRKLVFHWMQFLCKTCHRCQSFSMVMMRERQIGGILESYLYSALFTFPGQLLALKKINMCSLMKVKEQLTTFHCYRFTHYLIGKLFPNTNHSEKLLEQLYSTENDQRIHVFYLVVLLCIIYFKNTNFKISLRIQKLLHTISIISATKQPFDELYVNFVKSKKCMICINNHTKIPINQLSFSFQHRLSPEFQTLKKMVLQVQNSEWLPKRKNFHHLKSLCNFAYTYCTSNRILEDSNVQMLTSELAYPKPWLDFAYYFKERTIMLPSSRRQCFELLKRVLSSPVHIQNLSFSHYIMNFLAFYMNTVSNKVVSLNKPACFCNAKCTREENSLEKLYHAGLFILCKTCNAPVNYQHKIYSKVFVINDYHHPHKYFSCADSCSQFEIVDLYKCCTHENGFLHYQYKGLLCIKRKEQYLTSICMKSRTCSNIVTVAVSKKTKVHCNSSHQKVDTCFERVKQHLMDDNSIDKKFIKTSMCTGCIAYSFDFCSRKNKFKTKIRRLLQT